MHTFIKSAALAATAVIMAAGTANAYTLPSDGASGWVGKGEVQTAFAWNNAKMQQIIGKDGGGVTFRYDTTAMYSQDCEKVIENKKETKTVYNSFKTSVTLTKALSATDRKTGQYTGWTLTGFGASSGDAIPTDLCNPGGADQSGWVPSGTSTVQVVPGSESGDVFAITAEGERLLPVIVPAPITPVI